MAERWEQASRAGSGLRKCHLSWEWHLTCTSAGGSFRQSGFRFFLGCRETQEALEKRKEALPTSWETGKRNSDFPERDRTQGMGDTSTPFTLPG